MILKKRTLVLFGMALALGISRTVPGNADGVDVTGDETTPVGGLFK